VNLKWIPVAERPELDLQPFRQFVLVVGSRFHTGVKWARAYWGIACVRMPGADDEFLQYRRVDIEKICVEGDIDITTAEVTHFMPAIVPPFDSVGVPFE